jgi:hypothetical protein
MTDHEALQKTFSLSGDQLDTMRRAKKVTVSISEHGRITGVFAK